jgi:hypothetical protein
MMLSQQAIKQALVSRTVHQLELRRPQFGRSAEARRRNVHFLAYNTRFLILPRIKVKLVTARRFLLDHIFIDSGRGAD